MAEKELVFKRIESKFLLDESKYLAFVNAIMPYVNRDKYDKYSISNIYFDTPDFAVIRRSLEKPKYKEKLRLRAYGVPHDNDIVFLEIKKKYKGMGSKRRIELTYKEAKDYLQKGIKPAQDSQILHEIDYYLQTQKPIPVVYIAYDRTAYCGKKEPGLRITIDHNIRSRSENLTLSQADGCHELLHKQQYLVEIKACGSYPLWLTRIMAAYEIFPTSFSKYGEVYVNDFANKPMGGATLCLKTS